MVDVPDNSSTTEVVTVGSTTNGTLEVVGDHDWFKITLTAGQSITVTINGVTLEDPYLYIRDASGNLLFENDDISSGIIRDSELAFTANYTGTYYIDVGAWDEGYTGDYQIVVQPYTPPPLATTDQISDQLVSGYWGGQSHHFNVTQGGTITVNLTALTPAGQNLAREALALWSDIIGVAFNEVTSGGQIVFDDDEEGAFSDSIWSGGFITSSNVNVSTQWLAQYGTSLNSYSFQSYIHEIGHALGLGHAGNYNETARYPYDAEFQNDSWVTSVMSYFSQTENTYFAGRGFTQNFVVTPMMADILAMSTLYGLSTTTRTGNTTYGFNSNAGRAVFDASLNPGVSYTIFDSGGVDTLDYSGFSVDQIIDLTAGNFSNIGGEVGNVAIASGVIIENAVGGSGNDELRGNSAGNVLDGGPGGDALYGFGGNDRFVSSAGDDRFAGGSGIDTVSYANASAAVSLFGQVVQSRAAGDEAGIGVDTLFDIEVVIGSAFDDILITSGFNDRLEGGQGHDWLDGQGGADELIGGAGGDTLVGGPGDDVLDGGEGEDTASYAGGGAARVDLRVSGAQNTGVGGVDTLTGIEWVIGSSFNDVLIGSAATTALLGGLGNDTIVVTSAATRAVEAIGEGIDKVLTSVSFALEAGSEIESFRTLDPAGGEALRLTGNELSQTIVGNAGDNFIKGLGGNDYLVGGGGSDILQGGSGNDNYQVDSASDRAMESAGRGSDSVLALVSYTLEAGSEIEALRAHDPAATSALRLTGNELSQRITGNAGDNFLKGLGGNDYLVGGGGTDILQGGSGHDIYEVDSASDRAMESAGRGSDSVLALVSYALETGSEIEALRAHDPAATSVLNLFGNEFGQRITGNDGANVLRGGGGDDTLAGNGGNDRLDGGTGSDVLTGGAGTDRFVFAYLEGTDTITDFTQGERIDLVDLDANAQLAGDQAFTFIGDAAFSSTAGELRTYTENGVNYLAGDLDGDGAADFLINLASADVDASDLML